MAELGWTRDRLWHAWPADVAAARLRLYVARHESLLTEPFGLLREGAQIESIDDPKRQASQARAFNRRRIDSLGRAERSQAALREVLELDVEDEPEDDPDPEDLA